jgi:hypothetical protein
MPQFHCKTIRIFAEKYEQSFVIHKTLWLCAVNDCSLVSTILDYFYQIAQYLNSI